MSDRKFHEVVIQRSSYMTDDFKRGYKSCCSDCGTYHKVTDEEFEWTLLAGPDVLRYVSTMRAWNCCNEGEEPLDRFPEEPDTRLGMIKKQ